MTSIEVALQNVVVYSIPMRSRFRGIAAREGILFEGEHGWGEFCPFIEYDDNESIGWLQAALEQANTPWPTFERSRVPVNCTVPAVAPDKAHQIVLDSGCKTAKVKVADHPDALGEDIARVEAVRDALGPGGAIRIDANCLWDVDTAVRNIKQIDAAAGGLEYVEQPCTTVEELAAVRRRVDVMIAADESIRRAEDPLKVALAGAADVAIIKPPPLGGLKRSLEVAEAAGLPCVVTSTLGTSIDVAAGVALAASLPELDFACGLNTLALLTGDVVGDGTSIRASDGFIEVPTEQPVPDLRLLEEFRQKDPARTEWWMDRLRRVSEALRG
ncbi:O-succinylbenzoate synthase [Kribbella antibiotica]|uniref:o-succinylbenzoate synthase n=1 Tax=Kribbella antibiotica TaxID=190195 RepID=A0A4R4Z303_9ACTN|nr:o-succinylbenzoate synthase [Kribbella antibiotica]TDD52421.1 O-succinylbenzoate synthase [Kribbella antibiotica]